MHIVVKTLLFFLCLCHFIYQAGWYHKSTLEITGFVADGDGTISLQWDSGEGFNSYQQQNYSFLKTRGSLKKPISVQISGGVAHNSLSRGARVIIPEIRVDGRGLPIPQNALKNVEVIPGEGLVLGKEQAAVNFQLPVAHHLRFMLKTSDRAGIARIVVDGQESFHDLYRSNWAALFSYVDLWLLGEDGSFKIVMEMPRYHIDKLLVQAPGDGRIDSLVLHGGKDRRPELLYQSRGANRVIIDNPLRSQKAFFDPARNLFALFSALVVSLVLWYCSRVCTGKGHALTTRSRAAFLLGSLLFFIHLLWITALWPGVMSVDSLNIWRAAMLPDVSTPNHPVINELWFLFLLQFWNDPAVVPLAQALLLALLTTLVYGFALGAGAPLFILLPCYFFLAFSVPVALYTLTLWKDIPFALLVVVWALLPAYWYYQKRKGTFGKLSYLELILAFLSLFALAFFRFNGIVYLLFIPLLLWVLGIVRLTRGRLLLGVGCLIFLAVAAAAAMGKYGNTAYLVTMSNSYLERLVDKASLESLEDAASRYLRILDINKNRDASDLWHYYQQDRYAYDFLKDAGWADSYPYEKPEWRPAPALAELAQKIYEKSYQYPAVYFSWYVFPFLFLMPLTLLFYRWLPLAAIMSSVILVQVLALTLVVETVNWRYYYFLLLAGHFLLPILAVDLVQLQRANKKMGYQQGNQQEMS